MWGVHTLRLDRVGVYGHSAGGTAAAQALHEDRRIAAAVNPEGYLDQMDGELLPRRPLPRAAHRPAPRGPGLEPCSP
ncbi:hypothetical protein [Streptomyces subrutilus]|uniref:hypothetical protein n=1 Tax=Streptomyces subrutilus TaxID=36818 RepID=UPI0009A06BFD